MLNSNIMNLLDIIVISVLIVCFIRGIIRGFLRELISFLSVIVSIFIANYYYPQANAYISVILPKGKFIPLISFFSLFVFSLIACGIIAWAIKTLFIESGAKNVISRIIGAALGVLKAIIVIYLVIILLTFFMPSHTPIIAKSRLAPVIIRSYQSVIVPISPSYFKRFKQKFEIKIKKIRKGISKGLK